MLWKHEYEALTCVPFRIITPSPHVEKWTQWKACNTPYKNFIIITPVMIYNNGMMVLLYKQRRKCAQRALKKYVLPRISDKKIGEGQHY